MASASAADNPEVTVTAERMDTTPAGAPSNASTSSNLANTNGTSTGTAPKTDDPTPRAVNYRDMIQVIKKIHQNIEKLQEEVADLQIRWADTHLMATLLFDPEVGQIISDTQLLAIASAEFPQDPKLSEELQAKAKAQAEATFAALKQEEAQFYAANNLRDPEQVNKQYEKMCQELELEQSRHTSKK